MSFNVGMPMLALKRNGKKGKKIKGTHSGSLGGILLEMGEERITHSVTYDSSKSHLNDYHLNSEDYPNLYSSGKECLEVIENELNEYELEYRKTSYKGRGLRADQTVCIGLIVKPEHSWVCSQSPETLELFEKDTLEILTKLGVLKPRNVRMLVAHNDEGGVSNEKGFHLHICQMAYNDDGVLRGSDIMKLGTYAKLNREYPSLMRERGWDINTLQSYDLDATKDMNKEQLKSYKDNHRKTRDAKKHGRSTNQYIKEKKVESLRELASLNEQLHGQQGLLAENEALNSKLKQDKVKYDSLIAKAKKDNEILNATLAEVSGSKDKLTNINKLLTAKDKRLREQEEKNTADKKALASERNALSEQKTNVSHDIQHNNLLLEKLKRCYDWLTEFFTKLTPQFQQRISDINQFYTPLTDSNQEDWADEILELVKKSEKTREREQGLSLSR